VHSINFKKNLQKSRQITQEPQADSWFINEEDRVCKGPDYLTKYEDLHKLVKHLRLTLTKHDLIQYQTDPDTNHLTSVFFSTAKMKEAFLVYRDCMIVQQLPGRFGLEPVLLYGVNSAGRNVVFGVCMASDKKGFEQVFS